MKKQKMNRIQQDYIMSKAMWNSTKEVQAEKYKEFLSLKGLTDDDVNDDNFEALNAEYEVFAIDEILNSALAWKLYKAAEDEVIKAVIALYPTDWQERVRDGFRTLKTKENLIDLYLKTDIKAMVVIKAALLKRLAA